MIDNTTEMEHMKSLVRGLVKKKTKSNQKTTHKSYLREGTVVIYGYWSFPNYLHNQKINGRSGHH